MPSKNLATLSFSTLLFLVSHGVVAATTAAAFFGTGFFLLTHSWEKIDQAATTVNQPAPTDTTAATADQQAPTDAIVATVNQSAPTDATAATADQPAPTDTIVATVNQPASTDATAAAEDHPAPTDTTAATVDEPAPTDATAAANQPETTAMPRAVRPNHPISPTTVALPARPRLVAAFAQAAADKRVSLEQYRDARLRFLRQQQAQLELQLTKPNLSAAETSRLERQKAYWGRAIEQTMALP